MRFVQSMGSIVSEVGASSQLPYTGLVLNPAETPLRQRFDDSNLVWIYWK